MTGLNSTGSLSSVFEEVSKYNVQLNIFERLWTVCRCCFTSTAFVLALTYM